MYDTKKINNLDLKALSAMVRAIQADPAQAMVQFRAKTAWTGQTRSETTIDSYVLGGRRIPRRFKVVADEPPELLGSDTAPNPQELLMSAVNACMTVGYVANAALLGIELETLEIEMHGEFLDDAHRKNLPEDVIASLPMQQSALSSSHNGDTRSQSGSRRG